MIDAFLARVETQWFDEITLDQLAQDASVTVQTIIRRFGGKDGVVEAATKSFGKGVLNRRQADVGDIDAAVDGLVRDYEQAGPLVMRILVQEDRYPTLKIVTDFGRAMRHGYWKTCGWCGAWLSRKGGLVVGLTMASEWEGSAW